jgi:hypothetical protein
MKTTTTYTPRTDTCNHCGAFLLTHHTPAYCEERTARKKAEAEVERLKKRPFGCKCENFREKVLGDGCDECNKALVIKMLTDERDELEAEVERLKKALESL